MRDRVDGVEEHCISTPLVRLRFQLIDNRWGHMLEVGPEPVTFAESIEGEACPAYQEIHFQREGDGRVALLVGQSGPHHYSAVFRVREGTDRVPMDLVEIDLADRCRIESDPLVCTYRLNSHGHTLIDAEPASATWDLGPDRGIANLATRVNAETTSHISVLESGPRAMLAQVQARIKPGEATRRCVYTWSFSRPR